MLSQLFLRAAIQDGWFRYNSVEFTLACGRKFRYQMQDYPFRVDASQEEIEALVCRLIKDKYRYCQWDREHPRSNTEVEIFDAIKKWMLSEVATAQALLADPKCIQKEQATKPRRFVSWGVFSDGEVVAELPYSHHQEAQQHLEELLAREPGKYTLKQLKRTEHR